MLNHLPTTIIQDIASQLHCKDYYRLSQTCKAICTLSQSMKFKITPQTLEWFLRNAPIAVIDSRFSSVQQLIERHLCKQQLVYDIGLERRLLNVCLALFDLGLPMNDWNFSKAIQHGFTELCQALLDRGLDVNIGRGDRWTALISAIISQWFEMVPWLVERGADVNMCDDQSMTPLLYLSMENGDIETAKYLLDHGADINAQCDEGTNPLLYAAIDGNFDLFELLLARGGDYRNICADGSTSLHCAAQWNRLELAERLIALGVDIHHRNNAGELAIDVAARENHLEMVFLLSKYV